MTDLLVVSGEPVWPGAGGGRRTWGLVEALAAAGLSVRVLAPAAPMDGVPPAAVMVGIDELPDEEPVARLVAFLSPQPRLGRALLGPRRSRALLAAVADHRPRAVLFAGGHLAAVSPTIGLPVFVDLPTLAVRGTGVEGLKARWWEAVEARRAVAVSAASADDVDLLASWGARAVLVADGSSPAAWASLVDAVKHVTRAARPS